MVKDKSGARYGISAIALISGLFFTGVTLSTASVDPGGVDGPGAVAALMFLTALGLAIWGAW